MTSSLLPPPPSPSPPPPLDIWPILSESERIMSAHARHFLALSVLFLLPLSFSMNIYYTLQNLLTSSQIHNHSQILLRYHLAASDNFIILPLIYAVVVLLLSLLAIGSISFSVHRGFFGRPVKLIQSILSLVHSFLPLLLTSLVSLLIQSLICFTFGLFLYLIIIGFELLGFEIEQSSPYFFWSFAVVGVSLLIVLMHLHVNWALTPAIVVVESTSGFEALRRSTNLVKGMRGITLSLLLLFELLTGFLVWSSKFVEFDGNISDWKSWGFVLLTVITTTSVMILMLNYSAAITVLYMYCKAVHGELVEEIAEEFATEYVSLPFDDEKIPHLVSVIPT